MRLFGFHENTTPVRREHFRLQLAKMRSEDRPDLSNDVDVIIRM
jgi:hypothetical protein